MSDMEMEVFIYLDDLHDKRSPEMLSAHHNVMQLFEIPPGRSAELIKKWRRTFRLRTQEEARS